jgi:hypothetical protein
MNRILERLGIDETLSKVRMKDKTYNKVKNHVPMIEDYNQMLDLLELPETKLKYKYLVVIVDLATSECDFEPIRNKNPSDVKSALEIIFKRKYVKLPYASVQTDNGTEFKGVLHTYLYNNNILHKLTNPYRHTQNSVVEAVNRQLSRFLNGYMNMKEAETKKVYKEWTDILPILRTELNKYRAVKMPKNVSDFKYPFFNPSRNPKFKVGDIVHYKLDYPENALGHKQPTPNFRMGDFRYTFAPKQIKSIVYFLDEPYYRYVIEGNPNVSYSEAQLMKSREQEPRYRVKAIIGKKIVRGSTKYKIWWENYKKKDSTWEDEQRLIQDGLQDLINKYNEEN